MSTACIPKLKAWKGVLFGVSTTQKAGTDLTYALGIPGLFGSLSTIPVSLGLPSKR